MHLYFAQSAQILSPLAAQDLLGTQDLGLDPAGQTLAVAVRGQEVKPLKHGTVKEEQFRKVLAAGYDLLLLVTDPVQENGVVITEAALVIGDKKRCSRARQALEVGNGQVLGRLETLRKAAFA